MTQTRPPYGPYLLWWCTAWLLVDVSTQMPECSERSPSLAAWRHSTVHAEMLGFAGSRALMDAPFSLLWGTLSWLLHWGLAALAARLGVPAFVRGAALRLWPRVAPVVLLACLEALTLGLPLSALNTDFANFSLCIEDTPPVTISDGSVGIESLGILLAFPLACLAAGMLAVWRRRPKGSGVPVGAENVWPPTPAASPAEL